MRRQHNPMMQSDAWMIHSGGMHAAGVRDAVGVDFSKFLAIVQY